MHLDSQIAKLFNECFEQCASPLMKSAIDDRSRKASSPYRGALSTFC